MLGLLGRIDIKRRLLKGYKFTIKNVVILAYDFFYLKYPIRPPSACKLPNSFPGGQSHDYLLLFVLQIITTWDYDKATIESFQEMKAK